MEGLLPGAARGPRADLLRRGPVGERGGARAIHARGLGAHQPLVLPFQWLEPGCLCGLCQRDLGPEPGRRSGDTSRGLRPLGRPPLLAGCPRGRAAPNGGGVLGVPVRGGGCMDPRGMPRSDGGGPPKQGGGPTSRQGSATWPSGVAFTVVTSVVLLLS